LEQEEFKIIPQLDLISPFQVKNIFATLQSYQINLR